MAWQAILEGAQLATARARLIKTVEWHIALPLRSGAEACSLMTGDVGRAVFLAYAGRALDHAVASARATSILANAAEQLEHASDIPTFHKGFIGCGWALAHVGRLLEMDVDLEAIDEALVEIMTAQPPWLELEWLTGVAGFTIYALERMPATTAILELLLAFLDQQSRRGWRLPDTSEFAKEFAVDRERFPGGVVSLGVAHGTSGALGALAGIVAAGVGGTRAQTLFEDTVHWLAAYRVESEDTCFPCFAGEREGMLGWCGGDAGIAGALAAIGRVSSRPAITNLASEASQRIARAVDLTAEADRDRTFCHGWAGVAHVLARLHDLTGDETLRVAARRALQHCIDARSDDDDSLLTGSAGEGLVLLSAAFPVEPTWDRAFYLSFADL